MTQLTPKEVADIVFQRPERISNGILQKRPLLQKVFEAATTWRLHETQLVRNLTPKHVLVINTGDVTLERPHPRALGQALRELRALGVTPANIRDIRYRVQAMSMGGFDRNAVFRSAENYPFTSTTPETRDCYGWNDDAFLGASHIRIEGRNIRVLANTCYTPALEDYAHAAFIGQITDIHLENRLPWLKITP